MLTVIIFFPKSFALTHITDCTTLTQQGETYVLDNDIIDSSASTCITISANSIILDCQGHIIDGIDAGNSIGINVKGSYSVTIKNCFISDWYYGIYTDGYIDDKASNVTFFSNSRGLYILKTRGWDISNSKFILNDIGILLLWGETHKIYNNLFNNTRNYYLQGNYNPSYWNTTLQEGPNIVGGPYIGGNYWGSPDGTGYSDTCEDSDKDGICDSPYNLYSGDVDYLPLAKAPTPSPVCGNGVCEAGEDVYNCPSDCPPVCGNMICEPSEDINNCPQDCQGFCSDGVCNIYYESVYDCPQDCAGACGDSICNPYFENIYNCPRDCRGVCGDNICNTYYENINNCPQDCSGSCGDGVCNTYFENVNSCPQDCSGSCGDSICNPYFESVNNCPQDCQGFCSDGICNPYFENINNCPQDCAGTCGDGVCNPYYENSTSCPQDCLVTPPTGHFISGGSIILGLIVALAFAYFIFKKK